MTSSLVRIPAFLLVASLCVPSGASAQYFGRNKVQYESLDFHVLPTPHYEIHFYPEAAVAVEDGARMAERWYERIARIFQHDIREPRPLVLYADHPDFQQTNILSGTVGEGTGGVTEGLQDRIIMPLGSSYGDTHHVLGHEIVHSFQFDLASGSQGAGLRGLMQLPLWFIEGMAEYISVGRESPLTAMWMRDALLHGAFPTLDDLGTNPRRYFPYRFGHAFWAYVGGEYGDPAVTLMMRTAARSQWRPAVASVLRIDPDTLSAAWREAMETRYSPLMEGRTPPEEAGTLLLSPATGAGTQNLAPSLSPDGRYVAYLSEQDLFTIELYLADARTGEVLRSITSSTRDAHYDAMRFLDSSGAWAPDGSAVAVVVYSEGRNEIQLYDPQDGSRDRVIRVPATIGEIRNPAFSPDGTRIVFSGQAGGVTDLFMIDVQGGEPVRLTDDRYAQLQPTFSPDGTRLAFVTDLGPGTDFERLTFGPMVIAFMDLETGEIERITPLGETAHWNPQFTPDGAGLYFLADQDGFRDIYRVGLDTGQVWQVTRIVTGVSGITEATPALSVATETGTVAFTVFDDAEYHVYALTAVESEGSLVGVSRTAGESGAQLAPSPGGAANLVSPLLGNSDAGLVAEGTYSAENAAPFDGGLRLVALGQPVVGVGNDIFGTYLGGSVSALFSDILGDRNLYAAAQAQGELKDVGGQVFYQNIGSRWNWGLGIGHIPIRYGFYQYVEPTVSGASYAVELTDYRIFVSSAEGQVAYPFSANRRVEFAAGVRRYGFDIESDIYSYNLFNQPIAFDRTSRPAGDPLNLAEASIAFVEDNSFSGFTSPIRGFRTRIEVGQTTGTEDFTTVLGDVRRYYSPLQELTFAIRAMHFGRYGTDPSTSVVLGDLFIGNEYFIRGYSYGSFSVQECTRTGAATCAEIDRLLGQRLGVMNLEVRVPLLGTERFGLFDFPYLPTELVGFLDGGLAWNEGFPGFEGGPSLVWDNATVDRVPVFSAGVSARMSLFGALVLEVYYAKPFQRPGKGMHWGVNFVPGW
ncbi:MAG: peptidase S9 [Gammaproteobacteria bacterium]|nr:peptidase S9 [Gammaproteobacteria bacterium]MDE0247340.1 peptidase S9 [Gammaproteobacteria bacterium]